MIEWHILIGVWFLICSASAVYGLYLMASALRKLGKKAKPVDHFVFVFMCAVVGATTYLGYSFVVMP